LFVSTLLSRTTGCPGLFFIFPAQALESNIFLRSPGSFYWRILLETQIWLPAGVCCYWHSIISGLLEMAGSDHACVCTNLWWTRTNRWTYNHLDYVKFEVKLMSLTLIQHYKDHSRLFHLLICNLSLQKWKTSSHQLLCIYLIVQF
jgi:hypothetical protein